MRENKGRKSLYEGKTVYQSMFQLQQGKKMIPYKSGEYRLQMRLHYCVISCGFVQSPSCAQLFVIPQTAEF